MGCRQLGVMYGVHTATVARWIAKIREDLFAHVQAHLQQTRGIDATEIGSLLGFARSQIDVSLTGLLDERDE